MWKSEKGAHIAWADKDKIVRIHTYVGQSIVCGVKAGNNASTATFGLDYILIMQSKNGLLNPTTLI